MTALTFLRARRRKRICVGSGGGRFTLTRSESDKRVAEGGVAFSMEGVIFREMCKINTWLGKKFILSGGAALPCYGEALSLKFVFGGKRNY